MAINYPEILDKLLDNAKIGKVVTDVGSGFALALPLLMLIGVSTSLSVLPADRMGELTEEIENQVAVVERETLAFGPLLACSQGFPLSEMEKEHIARVLKHTGGNKKKASEILGIERCTLYAKIKTYGLRET